MTRADFLELGNFIAIVTKRETIHNPSLCTIKNRLFNFIILTGSTCCIRAINDSNKKCGMFKSLRDAKKYVCDYMYTGEELL